MNRHYQNYLVRKYAPLYQDFSKSPKKRGMAFGLAVGDGWFNIIDSLSAALCGEWLKAQADYRRLSKRVGKPRESFIPESEMNPVVTPELVGHAKSVMDNYYDLTPIATQVKEKFGGLRFYVRGGEKGAPIYSHIKMAEIMALRTCEVCGHRGRLRGGNWVKCLCNVHKDRVIDEERYEFERNLEVLVWPNVPIFDRNEEGDYKNLDLEIRWQGWLARAVRGEIK